MKLYAKLKNSVKSGIVVHRITWPILKLYRQSLMKAAQKKRGIDGNKVVFSSFLGRAYNDNPRYISEKLHEMRPETDIVWLYREGALDRMKTPPYVRRVASISREGLIEQATARVWVDNFRKSEALYISPDQYYINTWHGDRGFKRVGRDALLEGRKIVSHDYLEEKCSMCPAGSEFGAGVYRRSFDIRGEIMMVGCPRNDILIRGDAALADRTRKTLGVPDGARVLIYAPTYRDNLAEKQAAQIDLARTLECFRETTGEEWVCLLRAHYMSAGLEGSDREDIIDATGWPEMTELLLASDALITDYSSCAADFMLTGKPAFLYIGDMDEYLRSCRNFYFDLEGSPYPLARNMEELEELIRTTDEEKARATARAIGEFYGVCETGHACESVCRYIIEKLDKVKGEGE
ncbi:MAG: CDP-glycerol glycerophosphotransferase family protein [Clostridia bacterium]|nr:CDP-glycerol glycerophosphotransferase family protein [Clostridia bacterium]